MICPKCGNNLPDNVLMCPGCGQKFEFDVEPGYFLVNREKEEKKTSPLFYIGMVVLIAIVLIIGRKVAVNKAVDEIEADSMAGNIADTDDWDVFDSYVGKYESKDNSGNSIYMNISITELGVCTVDIQEENKEEAHTYYYAEAKVEGDNLLLFGTWVQGSVVKHDCDFGSLRRLSDNLVMWKYEGEKVFSAVTDNVGFMMDMPPKKEEVKEKNKKSDTEEISDEEGSEGEESDGEESEGDESDGEDSTAENASEEDEAFSQDMEETADGESNAN